MAKKKSKAQLQEERRRAMERKRRETGWQPPPEPDMERERLLADMAPLLESADGEVRPEQPAMAEFMTMVLDSGNLVEEPEFEGVYAHPLLCAQAFSDAIEELGLEDPDPDTLARDSETHAALMDMTVLPVLTDDLKDAILAALEALRDRARQDGDTQLVAHAAAVYGFLNDLTMDEMWAEIGVVQAVVNRSLSAGVEMSAIIQEEAARATAAKTDTGVLRRIVKVAPAQEMQRVLDKYPGLARFMADQVQDDWQMGVDALATGDLEVGFFTGAEISTALAQAESMGLEVVDGKLVPKAERGEDAFQAFVLWLDGYVQDLSTPERLAQMQARLDEYAAEAAEPFWLTFLSLFDKEFEEGDTSEHLHGLLVHAFAGEIQNSVREAEEEG